jgi:hypothetical protein
MLISPYYFLSYSSEVAWYFRAFVYGYPFIWNDKREKVKRETMNKNYLDA